MPTIFVGGSVLTEQEFRQNLEALIARTGRKRRLTIGTLVGTIRTKVWPENAIAGQPTRTTFVTSVKLNEFDGYPLLQDVLVSNQAQQLIAGSAAEGTPVTVELSATGTATVIGRAAYQSIQTAVDYYTLAALDGQQMEYTYGLRLKQISDLDPTLLADLNTWRTDQGLGIFTDTQIYFEDPQIDFHGPRYWVAYIGLLDGGRFNAALRLTCAQQTNPRDWYDDTVTSPDGDWWYGTPTPYPGQDPWYAETKEVVCS